VFFCRKIRKARKITTGLKTVNNIRTTKMKLQRSLKPEFCWMLTTFLGFLCLINRVLRKSVTFAV